MVDASTGVAEAGTGAVVRSRTVTHRHSVPRAYAPIAITAALLAVVPLVFGDSRTDMGVAVGMLLFACYATSFNIIFGLTGQLFLSVGALAGVGGYGSAILSDQAGLPFVLTIVIGAALGGTLGALFSWVSVRRSLDVIFTGIVTLTFSLGFENLLLGRRSLTGGETGLVVDAGSETFLGDRIPPYFLLLLVLVGFLVLFRWLQRSHFGWAFKALRDDEIAAELAGVDVAKYRVYAGFMGSTMIGLTGALYAHIEGFISPTIYAFGEVDVQVLVMLAFGGIGTLLGPVIGAVTFTLLDEYIRDLGTLRVAVYGAILILLFLFVRGGVGPLVTSWVDRLRGRGSSGDG